MADSRPTNVSDPTAPHSPKAVTCETLSRVGEYYDDALLDKAQSIVGLIGEERLECSPV